MKKSVVVLLHIGFWMCYIFLILIMLGIFYQGEAQMESLIGAAFEKIVLFVLFPSILSFYSFYFIIFPKYLQQKKYVLSFIYGLIISIGSALIDFANLQNTFGPTCIAEEEGASIFGTLFFMFLIALINGIVALVIKGFITWFGEVKLKEILQQKNHEMELALVKSQLDPHFLFNTINNIDVLILKNANEASNYLNKLSDIMRFMLYETKPDQILVFKEIEYIEKYIELQKIRTANSDYVKFQITGQASNKKIAPMVFIPFIENAFKHCSNKKLKNAINIKIDIKKDSIDFLCQNRFEPNRKLKQKNNGLGNELIQKRLQLIYPKKHSLKITNQDQQHSVHLSVSLC